MIQPTIALASIVKGTKDEAPLLQQMLTSIEGSVDFIFLNINVPKGQTVAKEVLKVVDGRIGVKYKVSEWKDNFVDARTESFAMVPKKIDWIMWLDTDDTIDTPKAIRTVIAGTSQAQQAIYVNYDYDHDEFGNTTVSHWVARVVRNNGSYKWQSSIADEGVSVHETLVEVIPRAKGMTNDFTVIHHSEGKRRTASLLRNIKLLEGMYQRQDKKGEFDPRTLFYLATHYYDAGYYERTKTLLQDYVQLSGWAEERCEAFVYLGQILVSEGRYNEAKKLFLIALGEYPKSPRPYLELAELSFRGGRYEDSAEWIEKCLVLSPSTTTMVQRPMENSFRAYLMAAQAYVNMGGKKLDKAKIYVEKAVNLRPLDDDAKTSQDMIDELISRREDIRAGVRLARKFEELKQPEKILPLINSLPLETQDNPLILDIRHKHTKPKKWDKKSIAIFVGQGPLGIWGPWSLKEGIGGSEEAVVQLSRQLAFQGWAVTIYATPGEKSGYDQYIDGNWTINKEHGHGRTTNSGKTEYFPTISWKQYYEFNPADEYNVLIGWRNPAFFDVDIKAKKKYLWLHDVVDKEEFIPERLNRLDKVIFVGQYHADLYKEVIPDEKRFVSGNGIMPEDFTAVDGKFKRIPHRMIYMSAYNRGLKILLDNWGTIKKAIPDATLDVYYGWESYDAINRDNPERMEWKDNLVKQMRISPGVTDYGRISHEKIVEEVAQADIFAYPCIFPEVYAISYVKALAGGAIPISTDFAELAHYKDFGGRQVHYEQNKVDKMAKVYIYELIKVLKAGMSPEKERKNMKSKVRESFSWKQTAEQWSEEMS